MSQRSTSRGYQTLIVISVVAYPESELKQREGMPDEGMFHRAEEASRILLSALITK